MPTTVRKFRADDALWLPAKDKTAAEGITVTDVLCGALERYNAGIGVEQQPDDVAWLVRWRATPAGPRAKVAEWSYSTPLPEAEARSMFKTMRRTMKNCDVHLVRRADYIVS
jgi:hypothetical protein